MDAFEGGEDVGVVAVDSIKLEEGGVEVGHQLGALGFVPFVKPTTVFGLEAAAGEIAVASEGEPRLTMYRTQLGLLA